MEYQAYLGTLEQGLRLDPRKKREIIAEIRNHIETRLAELLSQGMSKQAATDRALAEIGSAEELVKEYYAVHARSSWRDIALATIPHIALAIIFAFHLWRDFLWVVLPVLTISLTAAVAWRRGAPQWAYPWLGYALVAPILSWMLSIAAIGYAGWSVVNGQAMPLGAPLYVGIAIYVPISLVVVLRIVKSAARQDWLLISLAILPLPFFAAWLFFVQWNEGSLLPNPTVGTASNADTALVFLALAVTTAIYLKAGHRMWRIGLLLLATPILIAVAVITYQATPKSMATIIVVLLTICVMISPVLLDPSARSGIDRTAHVRRIPAKTPNTSPLI